MLKTVCEDCGVRVLRFQVEDMGNGWEKDIAVCLCGKTEEYFFSTINLKHIYLPGVQLFLL